MKISDIKEPTIILHTKHHRLSKTYDEEEFRTLVTLRLSHEKSIYLAIQKSFFILLDRELYKFPIPILRTEFIYKDAENYKHIISF